MMSVNFGFGKKGAYILSEIGRDFETTDNTD
jgi:hypothetical protein